MLYGLKGITVDCRLGSRFLDANSQLLYREEAKAGLADESIGSGTSSLAELALQDVRVLPDAGGTVVHIHKELHPMEER